MGSITAANQIKFQSCKSIFAQIREDLDSFDAQDLIDNRVMYRYVKRIISEIGIGYYMEKQAVLEVSRYKTKLPEDFYLLYSAFKCQSDHPVKGRQIPQGGHVMYLENTCEKIEHCKCDIEKVVDKITVRHYIDEGELIRNYTNPTLLQLTAGNRNSLCAEGSPNVFHQSVYEINIDNGYINTNFEDGAIYIKYYGFPFDNDGYPMIPDDEELKTAIEDYIKFKLFEKWYDNDDVPNLQNKLARREVAASRSFLAALNKVKTPSFQTMVDYKRNSNTKFDSFQFYKI